MTEKQGKMVQDDPGDSSVVLRVHLRWLDSVKAVTTSVAGPPVGHIRRSEEGVWQLAFAVQRGRARQRHFVTVDPDGVREDRWGLMKLGPGVWDIPESVFVEGQIHAFVTLLGVPDPAPWER